MKFSSHKNDERQHYEDKPRLDISLSGRPDTQPMVKLKRNWIDMECVEAFKHGDRAGLPFEGRTLFPTTLNEDILQHAMKSAQGSDESSIVDCFIAFVSGYGYITREQFVWDWCVYHQKHHGTGYGGTYRDHFQLVKFISRQTKKYPDLKSRIEKLREIADDVQSFGNGSLAVVYPAYCYAKTINVDPVEFVRYLTSFSHAHPDAMEAVSRLCLFIDKPETMVDFFRDAGADNDDVLCQRFCGGHVTALNTLMAAVKCAMKETEMEVIREAIRIGGDVDSVLATAMLVWKLERSMEVIHDTIH